MPQIRDWCQVREVHMRKTQFYIPVFGVVRVTRVGTAWCNLSGLYQLIP
jgi:hypothetical protein